MSTQTLVSNSTNTVQVGFLPRSNRGSRLVKRSFDIIASALGLLALSPLFLLIALWIKRDSRGPVFYWGPRLGCGEKPFGILKFRTMREEAASYAGPHVTAQGDQRITALGHWLRDTKLNELPQLWNVLVGEMSFVGPRPEDVEIARGWPQDLRAEVLSVRPGITSPASIFYRDEEKMLAADHPLEDYLNIILPDKLRLDQLYVRNHSFLADLDVIFWTLIVLLPKIGTTPIPSEAIFSGWLSRFVNRYFSWFVMDNVVAFIAVGLTGLLWRLSAPLDLGLKSALVVAAATAFVFSWVNSALGLGRIWWRHAKPAHVFDLALSSAISTLLVSALNWFWPNGHLLPPGMIFETGLIAFLGFVTIRYRERLLNGLAAHWQRERKTPSSLVERVLVVGAGECGLLATWLIQKSNLSSVYSIIGVVDDDPTKQGMTVKDLKVFGFTRRIPEIVKQQDVGLILFAIEAIQPKDQRRILKLCQQTSARVVMIPDLMTTFRERLSITAPIFSNYAGAFDPNMVANRAQQAGEDRRRTGDRRRNADRRSAEGARKEDGRRSGDRDAGQS